MPDLSPLDLTEDVRHDLWLFFGETEADATRMSGGWPGLHESALEYRKEASPRLRLDTPFGQAFSAFRAQIRR